MQIIKESKGHPWRKISIIIVIILAAGAGYYIWQGIVRHRVANMESTTVVDSEKSQQLEQIEQLEHPNLDRPINIPDNFPEDAKKIAREKIEALSSQLKENPNYFDGWLQLAIYRKMVNAYEAAKEIWEYLAKINPKNSVVFNNLGDLYGYYLKDYKKAEESFLKALENGPDQIYIYRNFYEFYRYVMKDDAKAKAILEQGIKNSPDTSQDLQNLLNNF